MCRVLHECVRTQQQHYLLATAVCTYCVKSRKTTTICTRLFSSTSTVVLTLSCLNHCPQHAWTKSKMFCQIPVLPSSITISLLDSSIPTQLLFFTVCLFWKKILVCRFGPQWLYRLLVSNLLGRRAHRVNPCTEKLGPTVWLRPRISPLDHRSS